MRLRSLCAFLLALTFAACAPAQPPSGGRSGVSGQAVMRLTQDYLNAAPKRFVGSPGHARAEEFIKAHFAPEVAKNNFIVDEFYANTPAGQLLMRNLIVKFPGKKDGIIVLGSHYETNYPLKDINFVGANDGACTTALLIAGAVLPRAPAAGLLRMARVLRRRGGHQGLVRHGFTVRQPPSRGQMERRRHTLPCAGICVG